MVALNVEDNGQCLCEMQKTVGNKLIALLEDSFNKGVLLRFPLTRFLKQ